MKKVKTLKILINLAILLLINVIYFGVWGLDHSASAWISYVFIHFSFLVVLVAPFLAEKGTQYVMSRNSIYTITSTYFAVEFVIGTIFIVWSPAGYKLPLFSQFAIMIGFVVALFINAIADTYTAQAAERHQDEMVYIRGCSMKLKELLSEVKGKNNYRKIQKLYDLISTSPARSCATTKSLENQVVRELECLENAVRSENDVLIDASANKIERLANERNRILQVKN